MPQSETTTKARGFGYLPCPRCMNAECSIDIDLADLTGDESCHCPECDERFGLDDVRNLIARWAPVVNWCDQAPPLGSAP